MTFSEKQIREEALRELSMSKTGKLTTTELIELLENRLKPTGKDAEIAEGRGDTYFSQKVRNLVSHRNVGPGFTTNNFAIYDSSDESWEITDEGRKQV